MARTGAGSARGIRRRGLDRGGGRRGGKMARSRGGQAAPGRRSPRLLSRRSACSSRCPAVSGRRRALAIRVHLERGEVIALERLAYASPPASPTDTAALVERRHERVRGGRGAPLEPDGEGAFSAPRRRASSSMGTSGATERPACPSPRRGHPPPWRRRGMRTGGRADPFRWTEGDVAAAFAAALAARRFPRGAGCGCSTARASSSGLAGRRRRRRARPSLRRRDPRRRASGVRRRLRPSLGSALPSDGTRRDRLPVRWTPRASAHRARGVWWFGRANALIVAAGVRGGIEDALRPSDGADPRRLQRRIPAARGMGAAWLAVDGDGDALGPWAVVTGERAAPREARRASAAAPFARCRRAATRV